ncbi:MAG: polyphosphate kinase 1 [Methanocorpusculum sp.]|nr:polyphosphate kinase 1 [Methanocorpusculum sp.]
MSKKDKDKKKSKLYFKKSSDKFPKESGRYFNRELSWLKFNDRLFAEAVSDKTPLLEKITFLGIVSDNIDEYFKVRIPAYQNGATPSEDEFSESVGSKTQIEMIYPRAIILLHQVAVYFTNEIVPLLENEGIHILKFSDCTEDEKSNLFDEIKKEKFSIVRSDRFRNINHDEYLQGFALLVYTDKERAVIPVQEIIDDKGRFLAVKDREDSFVLIEDVLRKFVPSLFPDETVYSVMPIRVTRDSDLDLKGDDADDLVNAIIDAKAALPKKYPSRLEVLRNMPFAHTANLAEAMSLQHDLVFNIHSPLGLADLKKFPVSRDELKFEKFTPAIPEGLDKNIFENIKKHDRFMFTPYQSFDGLVNFLNAAADDDDVSEIQMTLYRLGAKSPVVEALIRAAKNKKKVTAVVELKASFDEERNFMWAQKLVDAGVDVIAGVAGLKVHAKCCLVTRKDGKYATLSTGNYNAGTAKIYTDFSIFTADKDICDDLTDLFKMISAGETSADFRKLIVSPKYMTDAVISKIEREADIQKKSGNGHIILKVNSITDKRIINALYEASSAGVKIELAVRGICMLRPQVAGLSENITVLSVVGRFLEHARIFYFENNGEPEIFIGSPDMMTRNLNKRIEIICPILDKDIKKIVADEILAECINDKFGGYVLTAGGIYLSPEGVEGDIGSQAKFVKEFGE